LDLMYAAFPCISVRGGSTKQKKKSRHYMFH
jgi:hypothetical protein